MAWAKIDDQFFMHPKVIAAGRDARDLYLAALTYAGAQLTDGFIPDGALPLVGAMAQVPEVPACVERLVEVGLWEPTDGGHMIHDYLEYNPDGAEVKAKRKANAKRQADWRDRNRGADGRYEGRDEECDTDPRNTVSNGVTNAGHNGVSVSTPSPSPSPSPSQDTTSATARAREVLASSEPEPPVRDPLWALLERFGVMPSSREADQVWRDLRDMAGDEHLFRLALQEAIDSGTTPIPRYVRPILERCKRENCVPGQRPNNRATRQSRASPGRRASPQDDLPSNEEWAQQARIQRQERLANADP